MAIRIGAHLLSWGTTLTPEEVLPRVLRTKELGCGAFEVFLSGGPVPTSAIKEATAKYGLIPIGCAVIREGIDGDPLSITKANMAKAVKAIGQYIKEVHDMGGSLLVGPLANILGKPGAQYPTPEELRSGVETFRWIAQFASENGVKVAIEPLQWSEMPWPNTVQQVLDFINKVEAAESIPKNVLGVLADIYHMNRMEENYLEALRVLRDTGRLFHIHVAGPNRTPPRIEQHIKWRQIVNILKEAVKAVRVKETIPYYKGWEGTITIESFGVECDLPFATVGPGRRPSAEKVIATGVATLKKAGL